MIDTHTHLLGLADGPDAAVAEAREAGVTRLVCVAQSPAEAEDAVALAERHPGVRVAAGLHPHLAAAWDEECRAALDRVLQHPRVCAVGECGLDFYRDRAPRAAQLAAFRGQLALAEEHGLPVVIHTREAAEETLVELRPARCPVILHCFSLPEHLDEAVERGWYCSFAGNVTYPSAGPLREAARRVPEELLLVETDAPYLAPVPHRGRPNRPAYVMETLRFVAGVRRAAPEQLAQAVEANAARAFRW